MKRYQAVDDGDILTYNLPIELKIACCHCGLVHNYRIQRRGARGIRMIATQDVRATAQLRRHRKDQLVCQPVSHRKLLKILKNRG